VAPTQKDEPGLLRSVCAQHWPEQTPGARRKPECPCWPRHNTAILVARSSLTTFPAVLPFPLHPKTCPVFEIGTEARAPGP
jgi:hypothetical protein